MTQYMIGPKGEKVPVADNVTPEELDGLYAHLQQGEKSTSVNPKGGFLYEYLARQQAESDSNYGKDSFVSQANMAGSQLAVPIVNAGLRGLGRVIPAITHELPTLAIDVVQRAFGTPWKDTLKSSDWFEKGSIKGFDQALGEEGLGVYNTKDPSDLRRYPAQVADFAAQTAVSGGANVPGLLSAVGGGVGSQVGEDMAPDNPLLAGILGVLGAVGGGWAGLGKPPKPSASPSVHSIEEQAALSQAWKAQQAADAKPTVVAPPVPKPESQLDLLLGDPLPKPPAQPRVGVRTKTGTFAPKPGPEEKVPLTTQPDLPFPFSAPPEPSIPQVKAKVPERARAPASAEEATSWQTAEEKLPLILRVLQLPTEARNRAKELGTSKVSELRGILAEIADGASPAIAEQAKRVAKALPKAPKEPNLLLDIGTRAAAHKTGVGWLYHAGKALSRGLQNPERKGLKVQKELKGLLDVVRTGKPLPSHSLLDRGKSTVPGFVGLLPR